MAHTKVSVNKNWYGKVPLDKNGKPIPRNLWPKRRKFSWEVRWYSSDGKRYSKSFKRRKEAEKHARQLQEKVDIGKANKPRKVSLQFFIKEHKQLMKGQVAYSTLIEHSRALDLFAKHIDKNSMLEEITPRHAESFVAYRLDQDLAIATVNKDIRTLRGIFNLAIEPRGYLAEGANPFEKIKQRRVANKRIRFVSIEDFSKVFDAAPTLWWKTFLALSYTSAGRKDELLNLTWSDVDFENNNVSFMPKNASEKILAWEPKDHEGRIIPVPEKVILLLADIQSQTDESSPYVFINNSRLKLILKRRASGTWTTKSEIINNMLTRLKVFCKWAGVKQFCFHDLRRSCITNWARHLPIHAVQELAGHSKIDTTRKFYLSVGKSDRDMAREIQEKVMTKLTNY